MSELANNIVDELIAGNNSGAKEAFDSAIASKLSDALNARKIEVAQNFFSSNTQEESEEQETETEISANGSEQ